MLPIKNRNEKRAKTPNINPKITASYTQKCTAKQIQVISNNEKPNTLDNLISKTQISPIRKNNAHAHVIKSIKIINNNPPIYKFTWLLFTYFFIL